MAGDPEPEQSAPGGECPTCTAQAGDAARYCPTCGRPLAGPAPDVDAAGWVQAAWRLFVSNIPAAIGIGLVAVVPAVAFFVIGYFGMIAVVILADPSTHAPHGVIAIPIAVLGLLVVGLACGWPALQGGVYACFLEGLRTGKLTARHLGTGFAHWWACTWVTWLLVAAMLACLPFMFLLIGIPLSLGLATLLWLSLLHIVDQGKGGVAALSFAWGVMRGRFWTMLVYTLLVSVLVNAGIMAMYVGLVATAPLGLAAHAAAYDALRKKAQPPSS